MTLPKPFKVRGFSRSVRTIGGELVHVYKCKTCGARWSLAYESRAVGNQLHLLNHTAGHDAAKGK